MKKLKIIIILFFLVITLPGTFAQLINGGFENWNGSEPEGWKTSNSGSYVYVTKSTDCHTGNFALTSTVINSFGLSYGGYLRSGENGEGFSISERYRNLSGYYKFSPAEENDYIQVLVSLYQITDTDTSYIGYGIGSLKESQNYSLFNLNLNYTDPIKVPNSIFIGFTIANSKSAFPALGTTYTIDDLSLNTAVDIKDATLPEFGFKLKQNYPNPFNPETKIRYSIPQSGFVTLKIFDVLGKEIETLVNGLKPSGLYEVIWFPKNLSGGIYFYQLKAGNLIQTKKMIFLK